MAKNILLKIITSVAVVASLLGMCGVDGPDPTIPAIMMITGMSWIALFSYANGWTK